jgi:DNA-binding HxlR family transcriptional regulator
MRFTELEANTQASARTLTDRLRRLVEVGLIQRSAFAEVPPRVEYLLTPRGVRLLELLLELDRAFAEESTWKLEQS